MDCDQGTRIAMPHDAPPPDQRSADPNRRHADHAADPYPPTRSSAKLRTVVFRRGGRLYAVPIARVLSIVLRSQANWLFPRSGECPGSIEPCCSLMRLVDVAGSTDAGAAAAEDQQILVCHDEDAVVGFLIDEIHGLKQVCWSAARASDGQRAPGAPGRPLGEVNLGGRSATLICVGDGRADRPLTRAFGRPSPRRPDRSPGDPRAGGDRHAAR